MLKNVNVLEWSSDNKRKPIVQLRYRVQTPEDYKKYNKLCGLIVKLVNLLKKLDSNDAFGSHITKQLLEALYEMAVIPVKRSLDQLAEITTAAFCRRRLAVVLSELGIVPSIRAGITLIKQGSVRVGSRIVTDPGFHITRTSQNNISFVTSSKKLNSKIMQYDGNFDSYTLTKG